MKCLNCNNECAAGSKFCPFCGSASFEAPVPQAAPAPQAAPTAVPAAPASSNKKPLLAGLVAALLIVMVGVGGFLFWKLSGGDEDKGNDGNGGSTAQDGGNVVGDSNTGNAVVAPVPDGDVATQTAPTIIGTWSGALDVTDKMNAQMAETYDASLPGLSDVLVFNNFKVYYSYAFTENGVTIGLKSDDLQTLAERWRADLAAYIMQVESCDEATAAANAEAFLSSFVGSFSPILNQNKTSTYSLQGNTLLIDGSVIGTVEFIGANQMQLTNTQTKEVLTLTRQ